MSISLIGKSIGNYQIKAKLGEGGMGTVYLGEHPLIGKRVGDFVEVTTPAKMVEYEVVEIKFEEL